MKTSRGDGILCLDDSILAFSGNYPIDLKIITFRNHWFYRHAVITPTCVQHQPCGTGHVISGCKTSARSGTGSSDRFRRQIFVPGNGQNLANVHIFVHKHFGNTVI